MKTTFPLALISLAVLLGADLTSSKGVRVSLPRIVQASRIRVANSQPTYTRSSGSTYNAPSRGNPTSLGSGSGGSHPSQQGPYGRVRTQPSGDFGSKQQGPVTYSHDTGSVGQPAPVRLNNNAYPKYPQVANSPLGGALDGKLKTKSAGSLGPALLAGSAGLGLGALGAGAIYGGQKLKSKSFDWDSDEDDYADRDPLFGSPYYDQRQQIFARQQQRLSALNGGYDPSEQMFEEPLSSESPSVGDVERNQVAHLPDPKLDEPRLAHPSILSNLNKESADPLNPSRVVNMKKASLLRSDTLSAPQSESFMAPAQNFDGKSESTFGDIYFVAIVAGCSMAAIFGVIGTGYFFYKFNKQNRAAADVDYPAYGVVGPVTKDGGGGQGGTGSVSPSGDRKLAQSAQMYHYHHQKQQMIASEKAATSRHTSASDVESDEENEEGDYTVYECPGLAPTGEMEVKNPLFQDDVTPLTASPIRTPAGKKNSPDADMK